MKNLMFVIDVCGCVTPSKYPPQIVAVWIGDPRLPPYDLIMEVCYRVDTFSHRTEPIHLVFASINMISLFSDKRVGRLWSLSEVFFSYQHLMVAYVWDLSRDLQFEYWNDDTLHVDRYRFLLRHSVSYLSWQKFFELLVALITKPNNILFDCVCFRVIAVKCARLSYIMWCGLLFVEFHMTRNYYEKSFDAVDFYPVNSSSSHKIECINYIAISESERNYV